MFSLINGTVKVKIPTTMSDDDAEELMEPILNALDEGLEAAKNKIKELAPSAEVEWDL